MVNVSLPRPDLEAHRNSLILPMPELLRTLMPKIDTKLTTYVVGVRDARMIERWMAGEPLPSDAEKRLRFTYQIVMTLTISDSPAEAQAWLLGVNPELGDCVPIRLLRESNLDQVADPIVGAARAFAAGGWAEIVYKQNKSGVLGLRCASGEERHWHISSRALHPKCPPLYRWS